MPQIGLTGIHARPRNACDTWNTCAESIMDLELPKDFKEFLRLLRVHGVEYLLIGAELSPALFPQNDRIVRMGVEPVRIEVMTTISGVEFGECYPERLETTLDGEPVSLISLRHLRL